MKLTDKHGVEEFDAFAGEYDEALNRGLSLTGEGKQFFAEGRMKWLQQCLSRIQFTPESVLDFGCGTGGSTPYFFEHLGASSVLGMDPSAESLEFAARGSAELNVRFAQPDQCEPEGAFDLAFCNGVFHHIPVPERAGAYKRVYDELRPGGVFAFWENNPWNPVTRLMMSRVSFDRDAVLVWPSEARRNLKAVGFEVMRTDFMFIFPSVLGALRFLEPLLCKLPTGGQYQVLCRKPAK